jgi:hypothetical protein
VPISIPPNSPRRQRAARSAGDTAGWRPARVLVGATLVLLAACDGSLSHRSVADLSGQLPIGQAITRVRIELQDGRVDVDSGGERVVAYRGGVRRAADTETELAHLEQVPLRLTATIDSADPSLLVVRGPMRDEVGSTGVFAFELGIHVPPEILLEVHVRGNGNINVKNRRAATDVRTARGDLRLEQCIGSLRGRTGRGNVIVNDHRGDLDIVAKVGNMQAFVDEPGEHIRLVTGEGTVQCHVPDELDFQLDARAETGKAVASGFGLKSETVDKYGAVLTGAQGSGRTKIVLRTGSGHLSLSPRHSIATR